MRAKRVIDQVLPGNGVWVMFHGEEHMHPVLSIVYWHDEGDLAVSITVITFGSHDDVWVSLDEFHGVLFPSKKAARRWSKDNCFNGEFNEGTYS